jgi:hypothetical protein
MAGAVEERSRSGGRSLSDGGGANGKQGSGGEAAERAKRGISIHRGKGVGEVKLARILGASGKGGGVF